MIKVLLVDDHDLVRAGVRRLLKDVDDIDVVGEAEGGKEALMKVRSLGPDVVLMDIDMPDLDGISATERLKRQYPDSKVIALSGFSDDPMPDRMRAAGALGFLSKKIETDELEKAIRLAAAGKPYISQEIAQRLALRGPEMRNQGSKFDTLSPRERDVMMMIVRGASARRIGETLNISSSTVSTHRTKILQKIGVDSDVALAFEALKHGIIEVR